LSAGGTEYAPHRLAARKRCVGATIPDETGDTGRRALNAASARAGTAEINISGDQSGRKARQRRIAALSKHPRYGGYLARRRHPGCGLHDGQRAVESTAGASRSHEGAHHEAWMWRRSNRRSAAAATNGMASQIA